MTMKASVWNMTAAMATLISISAMGCSSSGSSAPPASTVAPEDAGPDSGGSGGDSGPAQCMIEVNIVNATCTQCAQANCCSQISTCFSDPNCTNFEVCLNDCAGGGDAGPMDAGSADACAAACVKAANQTVLDEHNAWAPMCMATKCAQQCAL